MPTPNHFPSTRAALLRELGALRTDVATSRRERAKLLAAEQSMIAEAATIERAFIVDQDARGVPPSAITRAADGSWWQAAGNHLRAVAVADGSHTIAAPVEPQAEPEPAPVPKPVPSQDTFAAAIAVARACAASVTGSSRVELVDDPGPHYQIILVRPGDALAADPVGACREEACQRHGAMRRERMPDADACGTFREANGHHNMGEC